MRRLHHLAIAACLSFGVASTAPAEPMFMGLGDPPGGDFSSAALAVSGDGSVVVGVSDGATDSEAFYWTAADGMVGLGDLPGGTTKSEARGVSSDGTMIVSPSLARDLSAAP